MFRRLVNYLKFKKYCDEVINCRNYKCPIYAKCEMKFKSKVYTAENYPVIDEGYLQFKTDQRTK